MNVGAVARGAFAVAAGYIVFAIPSAVIFPLTGHEAHASAPMLFMVAATAWGMAFATLAGYLAAAIGGPAVPKAAGILGGLIAFGACLSMLVVPAGGSNWSPLAGLILIAPMAVVGGLLRRRHKRVI